MAHPNFAAIKQTLEALKRQYKDADNEAKCSEEKLRRLQGFLVTSGMLFSEPEDSQDRNELREDDKMSLVSLEGKARSKRKMAMRKAKGKPETIKETNHKTPLIDDADNHSSTSPEDENAMLRLALSKKSEAARQMEDNCRAMEAKLKEEESRFLELKTRSEATDLNLSKKSELVSQLEAQSADLEMKIGEYESLVSELKSRCERTELAEEQSKDQCKDLRKELDEKVSKLSEMKLKLERVSLALSLASTRVNKVEDDYEDVKERMEDGLSNLSEMTTRCETTERALSEKTNEAGTLGDKCAGLEEKVTERESELKEMTKNFESRREELEKTLEQRESSLFEMNVRHKKARVITELIKGRCVLLEKLAQDAEARHSDVSSKYETVCESLSEEKDKVKKMEQSERRKAVLEREVRVAELEIQVESLENDNADLKSADAEAKTKIEELESKLEETTEAHNLEACNLREQSESMEKRMNESQAETEQWAGKTAELQTTIAHLQQELEDRDEQIAEYAQDAQKTASLEKLVQEQNGSALSQQIKVESLSCEVLELKTKMKQQEKENEANSAKCKNLERERDLLIADLKTEKSELVSYLKAFEALKAEKTTLHSAVKTLDEKLMAARCENEKMATIMSRMEKEKAELAAEQNAMALRMKQVSEKLNSVVQEKKTTEAKLASAQASSTDLTKKLEASVGERDSLAAEVASIETKNKKHVEDVKVLSKQTESAKNVIRTLEIALNKEVKEKIALSSSDVGTTASADYTTGTTKTIETLESKLHVMSEEKSKLYAAAKHHRSEAEKAKLEAASLRDENKKCIEDLQREKKKQTELESKVNELMEKHRDVQTNYQQKLDSLREARAAKCVNLEMELSKVRDTFKFLDKNGKDIATPDDDDDSGVINTNGPEGQQYDSGAIQTNNGCAHPWMLL